MVAVSYDLFNKYKDKELKKNLKKDYKTNIRKYILSLHKPIISIFISLLILFIICWIYTSRLYASVGLSSELMESIWSLNSWIIYILTIAFTIGVYVNVSIGVANINKNFIVSGIESYLFFIVISLGVIIPLYNLLITGEFLIGNIFNPYIIPEMSAYPYTLLIFMFIFYLVSFVLTYLSISNKDRLLKKWDK